MPSLKAPLRIPATKGKNAWPLIHIFPGDHKDKWIKRGGTQDNFRVQFGDSFYTRPDERCSFLSAAELGQLLGERIAEVFGIAFSFIKTGTVTINLYLPPGAKVWSRQPGKLPSAELIAAPPYLLDDEWVVMLRYSGEIVPVTSVKPRVVSLAEASIEPEECKGDTHGN